MNDVPSSCGHGRDLAAVTGLLMVLEPSRVTPEDHDAEDRPSA